MSTSGEGVILTPDVVGDILIQDVVGDILTPVEDFLQEGGRADIAAAIGTDDVVAVAPRRSSWPLRKDNTEIS